jgi:hypothetical protein
MFRSVMAILVCTTNSVAIADDYSGQVYQNNIKIEQLNKQYQSSTDSQQRQQLKQEIKELKYDNLYYREQSLIPQMGGAIDPATGGIRPYAGGVGAGGYSGGVPRECTYNSDCATGRICAMGICRN